MFFIGVGPVTNIFVLKILVTGSKIKIPGVVPPGFFIFGEPPWTRTKHPRLKRALLYHMS
jgi:hypothetical protein